MSQQQLVDKDSLDEKEVRVWEACMCSYSGFLCGSECLGIMCSQQYCCCEGECCLKPGAPSLCCICCEGRYNEELVCCKGQQQVCCCVSAGSIPPVEEVPCMLAWCGLTCYPIVGCCAKLGDIVADVEPAKLLSESSDSEDDDAASAAGEAPQMKEM